MAYLKQNSILRISDEKTMELVELYAKEECLWNTSIQDYKSKTKRYEAAQKISKTLDIKHFTFRHVLIKFKNLRSSYCQELKKIANSVAAGDKPLYRPKVFWFTTMDSFLRPHLQLSRASKQRAKNDDDTMSEEENETVQVKKEYDDNNSYYEDNDDEYLERPAKRSRNVSTTSRVSIHVENNEPNVSTLDVSFQPQLPTIVDNRFDSFDKCIAAMKNVLAQRDFDDCFDSFVKCVSILTRNMTTHHVTEGQQDDCFDSFGKYVSAMLKNMPTKRAMEIQPEIVKLLISGTIENKEGLVTQSDQNQDL